MYPSFTYSDLQKRFCEAFAFFPFRGLEQSGRYIYKRYTTENNTSELLGHYESRRDSESLHARVLLLKLLQKDIPAGRELLFRLKSSSERLEASFRQMKRNSVLCRQLLETMSAYRQVLTVYQHQVQEELATQLSGLFNEHGNTLKGTDILKCIEDVRLRVQEFLGNADIMYDCFLACTIQSPGFERIKLTADELEEFRDILGMIDEFRCLQEKTVYVLAQWKQEHMQLSQMNIMN